MVKQVRRKLRREQPVSTRDLILQEAHLILARKGVAELRLKDVADAIGIRTPSIYKHFESREEILGEIGLQMLDELSEHLMPDPDRPAPDWLAAWARSLVWFFSTRPAYVRLILDDLASPTGLAAFARTLGPSERTTEIPSVAKFTGAFRLRFEEGVAAGVFRPMDYSRFYAAMWGSVLIGLIWPYGGPRAPLTATELEQLQSMAAAIALTLAGCSNPFP